MVRGFRQFYLEFGVSIDPFRCDRRKVLNCFAAVAANALGKLVLIEFREKRGAYEYRFVDELGIELKIGISCDPRAWIHVSIPVEVDRDPKTIAEEVFSALSARPELGQLIKIEEEEKKAEGC